MTTRFVRHPDLRHTAVDGEGIVLHLGSRRYFSVNETGVVLLEALVTPRSVDELVTTLTDAYRVSPDDARRSVVTFLERCAAAKLVVAEES